MKEEVRAAAKWIVDQDFLDAELNLKAFRSPMEQRAIVLASYLLAADADPCKYRGETISVYAGAGGEFIAKMQMLGMWMVEGSGNYMSHGMESREFAETTALALAKGGASHWAREKSEAIAT